MRSLLLLLVVRSTRLRLLPRLLERVPLVSPSLCLDQMLKKTCLMHAAQHPLLGLLWVTPLLLQGPRLCVLMDQRGRRLLGDQRG